MKKIKLGREFENLDKKVLNILGIFNFQVLNAGWIAHTDDVFLLSINRNGNFLVVVSALNNMQSVILNFINKPVLIINPSGPES